ncbi:MAG: T9SS type A sorting domain-containing protein, partial [Candidatus Cloacimonetes bacterium]|nr:T9SS type A sorting domain-containing protein [Candidatus Cloacimonadota bacterium]
ISQNSSSWNKYFEQTSNITFPEDINTWDSNQGWTPIGNGTTKFTASYDGQNHTIIDLFIDRSSTDNIGLFGYIDGATIKNLGVADCNITGQNYVGGLVGHTGSSANVTSCYSTGSVASTAGSVSTGGLVGSNASTTIENSYSTCSVSGYKLVGGLVGNNYSTTITNCYSTGNVTRSSGTNESFGGFCGSNSSSTISYCYSIGSVFESDGSTTLSGDKGFVGNEGTNTSYTSNYFDSDESNQSSATGATATSTANMQDSDTFTTAGWDFSTIWAMSSSITFNSYPTLQWTGAYAEAPTSNEIASLSNLVWLTEDNTRWSSSYTQTADINMWTTPSWDDGKGFSPIGNDDTQFTGSYDGDGHTMSNLYVNRPSTICIGLFGFTQDATIQNLGMVNVYITGNSYVGGLVGYNFSSAVSNSYSTGSVSGSNNVGGLVGYNESSTVSNSYSLGDVTRSSGSDTNFGGFCGYNFGSSSTIEYCYSTGDVNCGSATDKGFVGSENNTDTYTANFFDSESSNQSSDAVGAATPKTTDEMTNATTTDNIYLAAGWDFKGESTNGTDDIWNIGNARNDGYPYLDWQYPSDPATLPVTLSTFTALYTEGATQLSWITQSEEDNIGWNIYRNSQEEFETATQINSELIPGNGTTTEPSYYNFADESDLTIGQTYYYWLESLDLGGQSHTYNSLVSITIPEPGNNPGLESPTIYGIETAPNPMRDNTDFRFTLDNAARVEVYIYNIKGELVKTLPSIIVEADSEQQLYWNGKDRSNREVSSGIYFYRVKANGKTIENSKLIIMK